MPRTGAQQLEDLEDGRSVYINGARINTVTRQLGAQRRRPVHRAALRLPARTGGSRFGG